MPSSSQAAVASSSFTSGTPKSRRARTPAVASVSASRSRPSTSKRAMPGSSSFASGSGATKSGMTNWSSESRVSRTSPRSEAVRRKRRSRVTGNELTRRWYAAAGSGGRRRWSLRRRLFTARGLEVDLDERRVVRPLLELDALGEELPRSAPRGEQRQRDEDPREPVDLAAREQAEDHEQRMEAQRGTHHLGHNDMPLELLNPEEEKRDPERRERVLHEGVQHRGDRTQPGPDVWDELGEGRPRAERGGVLPAVRHGAHHPEDPEPEPDAHADDDREQELALDVARDRLLHPHDQPAAAARRESSIDGIGQPLHVEQHVDRDDDQQEGVEEEGDDGEAGAFRPTEGLGRVLPDVLRPDLVEELLALVLDVDAAEVVVVEPALEPREILLGTCLRGVSGIGRKVVVHPVGGAAGLLHDHRGKSEDRECDDCCEGEIDERYRRSAWDPRPTEPPDEWIEQQRDEQRHEEEEEHVTNRAGHRPYEQQQQRQEHELRPARDLDRHRARRRHSVDANSATARIQGNLALSIWEEPRKSDKVARDMPSSRPNRRRRVERHQARTARRARRVALLVVLSAVFLVAIALTAFGSTTSPTSAIVPPKSLGVAQTRPTTEIVAQRGQVRLQLPISQNRLTAIGYHSAGTGALTLTPVGHQANEGLVQRVVHGIFGGGGGSPRWYQLAGGGTSALDVGAPIGSDVYSPVDGTVVAIRPFIIQGKAYGSEIDIQPQTAPG